MMVLAIIAGAFIGAALQPLGAVCVRSLLKFRGKAFESSSREAWLLRASLACFGACIGACAQTLPTACYLFAMLFIAEVAACSDLHARIIPNTLVLVLFIVRLAFGIPAELGADGFPAFDIAWSILGCVVCGLIFFLPALAGKKVGAGDVKFAAAMGFCLGLTLSLYALALMGILVLAYVMLDRQLVFAERLKKFVPMAPFICVAMMVVLLVQLLPAALV